MAREDIEVEISAKLRELRKKKGLTLEEFEAFTKGKVKAVVIGSYERGSRAISLAKLAQLAEIFQVPLQYFFEELPITSSSQKALIFDLRAFRRETPRSAEFQQIARFLKYIIGIRRDWNGEFLTIRDRDAETLSFMTDLTIEEVKSLCRAEGVLFLKS